MENSLCLVIGFSEHLLLDPFRNGGSPRRWATAQLWWYGCAQTVCMARLCFLLCKTVTASCSLSLLCSTENQQMSGERNRLLPCTRKPPSWRCKEISSLFLRSVCNKGPGFGTRRVENSGNRAAHTGRAPLLLRSPRTTVPGQLSVCSHVWLLPHTFKVCVKQPFFTFFILLYIYIYFYIVVFVSPCM